MITLLKSDLSYYLHKIKVDANKGTNGLLTAVAGSGCFRGAADLCVSGALRSGTGIVRLVSVEDVLSAVCVRHPSATFRKVQEDEEGFISVTGIKEIEKSVSESTAVLIGCGIGTGEGAKKAVKSVLDLGKPAVLDADALKIVANDLSLLKNARSTVIITPHIGEMSGLCKKTAEEIKKDREKTAREFSTEYGCVTVLKDNVTVISDESGNTWESRLGSEGLSKGGSGDVLAGLVAGLLASGHTSREAAIAGVMIHALASVKCAEEYGKRSMLPSDLELFIAKVMAENGF